jgi:L-aspartate oxidase
VGPYDYIIIGSGIAGLYTSLLARERGSVLVLTKGSIDECNTRFAQGGIAAPVGRGDSPQLHFQDTIQAGAGLSDPEAVKVLVEEAADRIHDLIRFGVPFDTQEGEIALAREAAHSVPRILHAGGDATGEHIETTLSRQARGNGVVIKEHCLATQLLVEEGRVRGVRAVDLASGREEDYQGRFIILATGGAGQLFRYTTNPSIATGDGIALAYEAGAEVMDMEFFQFHPTALRLPGAAPFLISEAVRGEGGILRNIHHEAFMKRYTPEGELAPRDVVARAILQEMKATGADHVYLDVTQLPSRTIIARFPHIYRFCLEWGLDITLSPVPVAPAAHYIMGGVRTNTWGETNISGLFAAGECACTGLHGANRLASNSLLETVVFAMRIAQRTQEANANPTPAPASESYTLPERDVPAHPLEDVSHLQDLLWEKAGIIRSGEGLEEAAQKLAAWQKGLEPGCTRPQKEKWNLVLVGRLLVEAALLREESRGAHFRSDFPHPSLTWQKHIIFRRQQSVILRRS